MDQSATRPGVQVLVDVWRVQTATGAVYVDAASSDAAIENATTAYIRHKGVAPQINSIRLAEPAELVAWKATHEDLVQSGVKRPAWAHHLYELLSEGRDRDTTATPLPEPAPPAGLVFPDEMRLDWQRAGYMLGNLAWITGWLIVAFLPAVVVVTYYAGHLAEWWTLIGVDRSLSWWDNREAFIRPMLWPGSAVTVLWFLLVWTVTHNQVFARFDLYPDRGPVHGRHIGVR